MRLNKLKFDLNLTNLETLETLGKVTISRTKYLSNLDLVIFSVDLCVFMKKLLDSDDFDKVKFYHAKEALLEVNSAYDNFATVAFSKKDKAQIVKKLGMKPSELIR